MTAGLTRMRMVIGGRAVDAISGETFVSENPYTGQGWAMVPDAGRDDVDAAVAAARSALDGEWGQLTGFARAALLRRLGDLIFDHARELAQLEVSDSGKLYREMIGQMNGLGSWYHYYAGLADKLEGRQIPVPNPDYLVYTRREPVGVVAAITPWNSPLLLLTWKIAPALAAGCTVVVKPSEHSPVSTLRFAELFAEAGFPPGAINIITGLSREVGAALASHPDVDKIAFTGSTATGRAAAHAAASWRSLHQAHRAHGRRPGRHCGPGGDLRPGPVGIHLHHRRRRSEARNDTPYGLASAVWTKDIHRAHRVAARIRAGTVWINAYRVVAPSVPFGGYNASGLGRENGIAAIDEYLETKSVWVELSGGTREPFTLG